MKKVIKVVIPIILAVALAVSIDWDYLTKFLGIVGNAAVQSVTTLESDNSELDNELKNVSVDKFFNFSKMKKSVSDSIETIEGTCEPTETGDVFPSEIPEDKLKKYVKDSFEDQEAFRNHLEVIYHATDLTKQEKMQLTQLNYNNLKPGQKKDLNVYIDGRVINNGDYEDWGKYPSVDWPNNMGLNMNKDVFPISESNLVPQSLDRYGSIRGTNFSVFHGTHRYGFKYRAIPYIPNEEAYHTYCYFDNENYRKFLDILYRHKDVPSAEISDSELKEMTDEINEKIVGNIKKTKKYSVETVTDDEAKAMLVQYQNYLKNADEVLKTYREKHGKDIDTKYGFIGRAAPWYNEKGTVKYYPGGAEQINIAVSGHTLYKLSIIREKP